MKPPGHKKLFTFWYSVLIYDLTVKFCNQWTKSWKLKEQMIGAARSGKQNIVEGSQVMNTSLKIAIKLTNTAKGSIEELLGDYEDFARQRGLNIWQRQDKRIWQIRKRNGKIVKKLSNLSDLGDLSQKKEAKLLAQVELPKSKEEAVNSLLTLCHQASYLLHRHVKSLEKKHETEGGYTEKLYRKRKKNRGY